MGIIRKENIQSGGSKPKTTTDELIKGIAQGEISALGQSITLVESSLDNHHQQAQEIIERCLPLSGKSLRIGITGVPGVGKSTFIESFGTMLCKLGKKVAVLAIDPSSRKSKGSILGDKTRMEELSRNKNAFIRPSPAGNSLGGVAQKTKETIILCEAAGFDIIIIETVGVGQSEIEVKDMVDFFLLLMLAGAGDELQGIKRGIMEMADALIINKADGENLFKAKLAKSQYSSALHLFPPAENDWISPVLLCSSLQNEGIDEVWKMISSFQIKMMNSGYFNENRKSQSLTWMNNSLQEKFFSRLLKNERINDQIQKLKLQVENGELSPFAAVELILNQLAL